MSISHFPCHFRPFDCEPISNISQPTKFNLNLITNPSSLFPIATTSNPPPPLSIAATNISPPQSFSSKMATISSSSSTATLATSLRTQKRTTTTTPKIKFLPGINGYQGLKIHNNVVAMGTPISTEQCFANFASSMRANPSSTKKGGALSSTCNAAFEIFKIASIMNGLTLVGVAIGFVLLRIEASVEEAESSE